MIRSDQAANGVQIRPGTPFVPMMAHPTPARNIRDALQRMTGSRIGDPPLPLAAAVGDASIRIGVTCEIKYDGERLQVHRLEGGMVKVFSRNLEDRTERYPDLVKLMSSADVVIRQTDPSGDLANDAGSSDTSTGSSWKPASSFILDCECVPYDRVNKHVLPFQALFAIINPPSSASSLEHPSATATVGAILLVALDLLHLNGESLVRLPLRHRRDLLRSHFREAEGEFSFPAALDTVDPTEVQAFLTVHKSEGLMLKKLDGDGAAYEPGRRSDSWLKVKKDFLDGVGDSLDLVVIGAYTDNMRADRFASYLLGCYEDSTGQFQSMCRVFGKIANNGPPGDEPDALAVRCRALVIPAASPRYSLTVTGSFPDVWIDAKIVVEVACAMLSLSANHTAASGLVDPVKGISARFPRLVRERADKTPEEATTAEQVALMFKAQVNESGVV